jgi:CRISPR-associated endonuclease/helicase Cas3
MCPRHRRAVLDEVRCRLAAGEPVRLVSTSLIESGVDVDFPEVWRAAAGLDSIAQAAGRCNREGRRTLGRTVVFVPADAKPPRELEAFWQAARPVFRRFSDGARDLLGLDAVRDYFQELYWQKGDAALDAAKVGERRGILPAIAERAGSGGFPFAAIAQAFKVIDEVMEPVIVPLDDEATMVLSRIASMDRALKRDLRRLQQYTVSIPPGARKAWLASGVLRPVHAKLGDALLRFEDLAHYDPVTGVRLDDQWRRSAEDNVW